MKTMYKRGFTLIEMLIVTVLLALVVGMIAYLFGSSVRSSTLARTRLELLENARSTLSYMSRFIRLAGIQPVDDAIETMDEHEIKFQADVDDDEVTDRFSFVFDPEAQSIIVTRWIKNAGGGFDPVGEPQVVMDNVTDLEFHYYTAENVETSDPDQLTSVEIEITLQPPTNISTVVREMAGEYKQSTRVYCPNLAWRLAAP